MIMRRKTTKTLNLCQVYNHENSNRGVSTRFWRQGARRWTLKEEAADV